MPFVIQQFSGPAEVNPLYRSVSRVTKCTNLLVQTYEGQHVTVAEAEYGPGLMVVQPTGHAIAGEYRRATPVFDTDLPLGKHALACEKVLSEPQVPPRPW